jgi:protein-disulfide isomerase
MPAESSLSSAPPPPPGPDDHVQGSAGVLVVEYADYGCPYCARTELLLAELPLRRVFRHFPVVSKHPRARALACAVEAAALQDAFWQMHDSLMRDQAHADDPHLWERVRRFGLDLDRFERDRRSDAIAARVDRDFRSGLRAGVTATPTLFVDERAYHGEAVDELIARLRRDARA